MKINTSEKLDKKLGEILFDKYGDTVERRDYYDLEKNINLFGKMSKRLGIMYLVDISENYYLYINILTNSVNIRYLYNDTLISINRVNISENIIDHIKSTILLIDIDQKTKFHFRQLSKGIIPLDIIREDKLNNLL